jgi:type IV pilus assembly protein PilY1
VNGLLTHTAANTCATAGASCAASPGNAYTGAVNLSFTCPGSSTTAVSGSSSCDINGVCTIVPVPTTAVSGSFNAQSHNRFYGIVAYGGVTARTFSTQATAKTYDQNRLTDISYASPCFGGSCTLVNTTQAQVSYNLTNPQLISTTCADGSTKCTATSSDPGWYYEYGDVCPLQSCPVAPPWTDEKTGAGANVVLGCTTWGGFRPYGVTISSNPCSGNQGAPTVYDYSVNYITGQPSSFCNGTSNNGNAYIASQRSVTAAPGGATVRVDINQNGQINYSVLQLDSGSPATSKSSGTRSSAGNAIYWLQVPRQLHQCRHVDPANCN